LFIDKELRTYNNEHRLQAVYGAVKEADPNAFVIGGIAGGATTYTKEFMGLQISDCRLMIENPKSKIQNPKSATPTPA